MKMGKIGKWLIITPSRGKQNINRAEKLLYFINMKEKQNFLEVGCGGGPVSKHIAKKYSLNVTGTDVDPELIQHA